MDKILKQIIVAALLLTVLSGCATTRKPIPIGFVPQGAYVTTEDEQYGQTVLAKLSEQFKLDQDDRHINRVRDIVDRLAKAAGADNNPWNVYVFNDDEVKNAAATRGNYIFTWTGMLRSVQNDGELATVLAHEMGHVLAGHTMSDPAEEANSMISGIASQIGRTIIAQRGGDILGSLGEALIKASMEALLVNPEARRKELEADEIGLFLMADAGYDPLDATEFWSRAQNDPSFGGTPLQFLSTHPGSSERLKQLSKYIPHAEERYEATRFRARPNRERAPRRKGIPAPF